MNKKTLEPIRFSIDTKSKVPTIIISLSLACPELVEGSKGLSEASKRSCHDGTNTNDSFRIPPFFGNGPKKSKF